MIFTVLNYRYDTKILEVQYLEDNKTKYAFVVYSEGKYEEAKKELTEFITKKEPSD